VLLVDCRSLLRFAVGARLLDPFQSVCEIQRACAEREHNP
jgi:hypothetical protein